MDEILAVLTKMQERMEAMENSIEELKSQQRPMTSKDYLGYLRREKGIEFEEFLAKLHFNEEEICKILEEKTYNFLLRAIDFNSSMRIFKNNKNTIYIFKNTKWQTLQKEDIEKLQKTIYSKVRDIYRAMVKSNHKDLQMEKIKELSYLEQREIISQVKDIKHGTFKNKVYKIMEENITS